MSLTCHEEIGRVGRVGRGCYEETASVEFKLIATPLPVLQMSAHIPLLTELDWTAFEKKIASASVQFSQCDVNEA